MNARNLRNVLILELVFVIGSLFLFFSFSSPHIVVLCKIQECDNLQTTNVQHSRFDIEPIISVHAYSSASYVEHTPIFIGGNADFLSQAASEGWPGTGTIEEPIIISGYKITSSSRKLIEINNTDLHFQVIDNVLDGINGIYDGIFLTNTTFASIVNNTISNSLAGITLFTGNQTVLKSNTAYNNVWDGISIIFSDANIISNNILYSNGHEEEGNGILIHLCEGNVIINNSIYNNIKYGIDVFSSDYNNISWNNFIDNNPGGTSQASDTGHHNSFMYNYWADWTSPDNDSDGLVDVPYKIDGTAGNTDPYPLAPPDDLTTEISTTSSWVLRTSSFSFLVVCFTLSIFIIVLNKRKKT
ncbi:MAG: NosD domain-containing protein [Promethearchaeota archaeon]